VRQSASAYRPSRSGSTAARHGFERRKSYCGPKGKLPDSGNACQAPGAYTCEVGSYQDEAYGVKGMTQGVMEWVQDCYLPYPTYGSAGYVNDPTATSGDSCRSRLLSAS